MTDPRSPLLRVLTGPAAGGSKALPASGRLLIGHEFWHDIVLRDPSTRGSAVEIRVEADGATRITVLEGQAQLLGTTIGPGGSAVLPPFVPVRIGRIAFAWGEAESSRWADAEQLVATTAAEPAPLSEPEAVLDTISTRWSAGPARLWRRVRRPAIIGGAVLAAASIVVPPAVDAIQYGIGSEYRARRVLDKAGYKKLKVEERLGTVEVSGVVGSDADRLRIQELLADASVEPALKIQTGASLARAVADVARLNGVQAQARPQADGGIMLATAPIDDLSRDKLAQVIKRDVPGLKALRFSEDLAVPKTVSEATKRVASVVTGEPPYILTEDGGRYFAGALLPSGYYLVGIEGNQVLLDRRGKKLVLKF